MVEERVITRRTFFQKVVKMGLGSAALWMAQPWRALAQEPDEGLFNFVKDPDNPTSLEKQHLITIGVPKIAEDGGAVPVKMSMGHPMEPDHYIKSFQIFVFDDPVLSKGKYHFSPANGEAFFYTQLRLDSGDKELYVVAECSQHGRWVGRAPLKVVLGGC